MNVYRQDLKNLNKWIVCMYVIAHDDSSLMNTRASDRANKQT